MKSIEVQKKPSRSVKIAVVATAGAAAIGLGMNSLHGTGSAPAHKEHSTTYLNTDEKETGVVVHYGDTAEELVQVVNGNHLSGQALLDAENYVNEQGTPEGKTASGVTHYDLHPGQQVSVPVLPEQQIHDINRGDS